MLVICYPMPSALSLYWTSGTLFTIGGLLWRRHQANKNKPVVLNGVEVISPPRETRQMRRNKE